MHFKKTLLSSAAIAAVALLTTAAHAQDGLPVYVSVFGGSSFLNDVSFLGSTGNPLPLYINHTNMGYILGGAVGMDVTPSVRAEVEVSHSSWEINALNNVPLGKGFQPRSGDYSASYLMGNLWYDFHNNSVFTPYVGGGIGAAFAHQNMSSPVLGNSSSDTPAALAFQIGVGTKMELAKNIDLDIGYRFKDVPGFTLNFPSGPWAYYNYSLVSHNVQAGLTFHL